MNGRQVLITGGLGFIGSNLVRRCLQAGAKVTIYDCLDPHSGGNEFHLAGMEDDVEVCRDDILDFDRLAECVEGKEIIFNAAASTSHTRSMQQPWLNLDVNVRGVLNLLEAIRSRSPDARLIQLGTTTQFGRLHYRPADEQHPEFPRDMYSANKSAGEKYVLVYARAHRLRATAVRLSNTYGPRACIHSPEYTFNNYFVGQAFQDRTITVFGDGKQLRNVLYIDDAVEALARLADVEDTCGQALLVAGDAHFSIAELAEATVRVIGRGRVEYVDWPEGRREIDVGDAVISNERIKSLTDWKPACDLTRGLEHTRQYYEHTLEHYLK